MRINILASLQIQSSNLWSNSAHLSFHKVNRVDKSFCDPTAFVTAIFKEGLTGYIKDNHLNLNIYFSGTNDIKDI